MTRQETLAFIRLGHDQLLRHTVQSKDDIKLLAELNDA